MFNLFNSTAPGKNHKSTTFDLSHDLKLTTDIGRLSPVLCEPVLPGDKFRIRQEVLLRFQALLAPVMHEIDCSLHFFFIPTRIMWKGFEEFMTGGPSGTTERVKPRFVVKPSVYNSLTDFEKAKYFGLGSVVDLLGQPPIVNTNGYPLNVLSQEVTYDFEPFMSFYLTWYHYYRDANFDPAGLCLEEENYTDQYGNTLTVTPEMVSEMVTGLEDGVIEWTPSNLICYLLFSPKYRAWEKDYFTSALPWAQRGPELMIPGIGIASGSSDLSIGVAPGSQNLDVSSTNGVSLNNPRLDFGNSNIISTGDLISRPDASDTRGLPIEADFSEVPGQHIFLTAQRLDSENVTGLELSPQDIANSLRIIQNDIDRMESDNADLGTINNLRRMLQIQRFSEAEARGGSRYPEWLQQIWGTHPGDYRLQRPEYLGGSKTKVVVSEVLQQSSTSATPDGAVSPLGDFAGRATTAGSSRRISAKFREYGVLIGVMSLRPRSAYMQGMTRKFGKYDKYEYGNPYFAHLGEQEVKNKEVFYSFDASMSDPSIGDRFNEATFGYQSRYAEYKFSPNRVCGQMRGTLSYWHLTRKFSTPPALNRKFIYIDPEQHNDIFAVKNIEDHPMGPSINDHIVGEVYFDIKSKRKLPRYGIPV